MKPALIIALMVSPWLTTGLSAQGTAAPSKPGPAEAPADWPARQALFNYDQNAPMDLQVVKTENVPTEAITIQEITFASPVAGRVTATLVAPAPKGSPVVGAKKRYAGVIFMHWGQGDRSEFLWEATLLARSGAVAVSVDAPWARPEPWKQPGEDISKPELARKMYIQNTVDLRRTVDMLLARGDVEAQRLAYVGHSFGATQGGVLAGVERRIKTFVLMGGLPGLTSLDLGGARKFDEYQALIKEKVPPEMWQAYCQTIEPLTPTNFIGHAAPSSVLMQFGTADSWISTKAAERYFAAASKPKAIKWYRTSHEFNDLSALADRLAWLHKEIGLPGVTRLLEESLGAGESSATAGRARK